MKKIYNDYYNAMICSKKIIVMDVVFQQMILFLIKVLTIENRKRSPHDIAFLSNILCHG